MVSTRGGKPAGSERGGNGSGVLDGGLDEVDVDATLHRPATRKRARQPGAATPVAIAVKTEEDAGGSSRTTAGTSKRARPAGFIPSVPAAVKAEAARRRAVTPVESLSSEPEAEPHGAGEIGVAVST